MVSCMILNTRGHVLPRRFRRDIKPRFLDYPIILMVKTKSKAGKKAKAASKIVVDTPIPKQIKEKKNQKKVGKKQPKIESPQQMSEEEEIVNEDIQLGTSDSEESEADLPMLSDDDSSVVIEEKDVANISDKSSEDEEDEEEKSEQVIKIVNNKARDTSMNQDISQDSSISANTRVFVSNLARSSTSESIASFFESNNLTTVDLYLPMPNNVHKGFAFAEFKDIGSATKAVSLSGQDLDGASITICFAKPRKDSFSQRNQQDSGETNILFVKNLGSDITTEVMQNHFKESQEVRVMTNEDGSCRGHAYVEYHTSDAAKAAKEKFNGSSVNGSRIMIDFAKPRGSNPRQNNSFGGRGRSFGGRGGSQRGRGGGRGNFDRGGRGSFGNRGGSGSFNKRGRGGGNFNRGGDSRPRGNKIQFNDDD
ncbi:hypothetical protein HZS_3367 [Henneguya salminicola]|nr:hypothetical protein HZS_3367 [Henneguya salminicola]